MGTRLPNHLEALKKTVAEEASAHGIPDDHMKLVFQDLRLHTGIAITSGQVKEIMAKLKARHRESDFNHNEIGSIINEALKHKPGTPKW